MQRTLMAFLAMAGAAHAQETPAAAQAGGDNAANAIAPTVNGRVLYEPAFFARFTPQNALDMVNRVPGFTLDEGDDERRGFSGAVGNVLIDGRRPSAKSQGIESILSRIPAEQVSRIELIRDTAETSDAAGQSSLINVVRTPSGGAGVWEASVEFNEDLRAAPRGEASWTGRTGALDYSVGVSRFLEHRSLNGFRTLTDADGDLMQRRRDYSPRTYREAAGNGELTFPLLDGSMRINAQVERWNFRAIVDSIGETPLGAHLDDFTIRIDEREQTEEIGLNYDRAFGPVSMELVGLATRAHYANDESTTSRDLFGDDTGILAQRRRNDSGETILRGTLSWPLSPQHRFDIGGEAAYNSLETDLMLTEDVGAGPILIPLPSANVKVEEERAEVFATWVWRAPQNFTVEATLAAESSTLTQSGDTNLETELSFLKPSLQVTRRIGERNQIRARIWRDVGQLDFSDFVSAAGLSDDIVFGGNPDLRPETSWRGEIAGDWRFGADGALGLRAYRWELEDAADVIPVGPPGMRFGAPGNIGSGWVHGLQLTTTIPLSWALPGARLTFDGTVQDSEVEDPTNFEPRVISGFAHTEVEAQFRQDLPESRLAWGAYFYKRAQNITFRHNETDNYEEGPFLDLWVETTALPANVKLRLFANNVLDAEFTRDRRFFDPDRTGPLDFTEYRFRTFGAFYGFVLNGSF